MVLINQAKEAERQNMKKLAKLLVTITLAIGIIVLALDTPIKAATIKLNKTSLSLNVGDAKKLKVKGTKASVTWSTSDKKVATVNKSGKVTAKSAGTCTITAKVSKKTLTCKVTVKAKKSNSFDSSVKIANVTFPSYKDWLDITALTQKQMPVQEGAGMGMYAVDAKASSLIFYVSEAITENEVALYSGSKDTFQLLGEVFTQALVGSLGEDAKLSTTVSKENGAFVGKAAGSITSDTGSYSVVVYFKFLGNNFICTGGMNQGSSLSSSTDSIAIDALNGAKLK